jgi:hypothetical protein
MRAALIASVAVFGLIALPVSSQAAVPGALQGLAGIETTPDIVPTAGGCGPGWHPQSWRDRWGNWRRRCVPNRW